MRIGVPTEIKVHEYRVAVTPAGVHSLTSAGHQVVVQSGAGVGSALSDDEYRAAGATVVADAAEVWARADLICKVKEGRITLYHFYEDTEALQDALTP